MLNMKDIRDLIKLVDESSITEFGYENDGVKVSIQKKSTTVQSNDQTDGITHKHTQVIRDPNQQVESRTIQEDNHAVEANQTADAAVAKAQLHKIESPMVGTFYCSPSPEAGPFVKEGDHVNSSSVVCIIEAMKLMNEIESECNGEIVEVLVENGQLVEYGQPLFLVQTK